MSPALSLLRSVFESEANIQEKRQATERLIEGYGPQKILHDVEAKNFISKIIRNDDLGPADYELRYLIFQFFYNIRNIKMVMDSASKSIKYKMLKQLTSKTFDLEVRSMIGNQDSIKSLKAVEVSHASKLYTNGPSDGGIWVDFNVSSITTNLVEPISQEIVLIEILYSSIESWNTDNEDTLGTCFHLNIKIIGNSNFNIGFRDLTSVALVKQFLIQKTGLLQAPKVSVPVKNFLNYKAERYTGSETSSQCESLPPPLDKTSSPKSPKATTCTPMDPFQALMTPPRTLPSKIVRPQKKSSSKKENLIAEKPDLITMILDNNVERLSIECQKILSKMSRKGFKKVRKWRPAFHLKERYLKALLRNNPIELSVPSLNSWDINEKAPNFPKLAQLNLSAEEILKACI